MAEDVLTVLSDCVQNNRQIKEMNEKICLGGRYFPKDTETTLSMRQSRRKKTENYGRKCYNLGEVHFFLENQSMPHDDYIRKAQEKSLMYILQADRNPLLKRINGKCKRVSTKKSAGQKASGSIKGHPSPKVHSSSESSTESTAKRPRVERTSSTNERAKVRTYSRNYRSSHESQMSLRQQSLNTEDQSAFTVSTSSNDIFDELTSVRNEMSHLETSLKTMTTFLKDFMGLSADQLQVLQEDISCSDELNKIASQVKNKIIRASMPTHSGIASAHLNVTAPKYCYKAVKHPSRGWEMVKEDLSSALSGCSASKPTTEGNDHKSKTIEECLAKGTVQLKRAFSILISQMREFNKPVMSHEESDSFCEKVVKDCLMDAVDSFREMFKGLLSSGKSGNHEEAVEKWVEMSRTELGKLFQSLAMTLQSLRDIPASPQNPPMTLFHLPEPTFSLALNPAKVTHSVVLEMYVRIGLAELRHILMLLLGLSSEPDAYLSNYTNGDHKNVSKRSQKFMLKETNLPSTFAGIKRPESNNYSEPSTSSFSFSKICDSNPGYKTLPLHEEQSKQDENYGNHLSASCSIPNVCSSQNSDAFRGTFFYRNGKSKNSVNRNRNSPYQTRRSSESDYRQYNKFKASLGNTLVSSFKKQIQEKIQASSFHP